LIFRQEGFNDVEFKLGPVSAYAGLAAGTTVTVTNWDKALVLSNYNASFSDVKFIALASTSFLPGNPANAVWLTDADALAVPTDVSGSRLASQISKISSVGGDANLNTSSNSVQSYVVAADSSVSYTYRASNGGLIDAATLGGVSLFPVETTIPGTMRFYKLTTSNLATKPAATQIGSFTFTDTGVLTFTAGGGQLPPPTVPKLSIAMVGGNAVITFTGESGVNYRLRGAADIKTPLANWQVVGSPVTGNGATTTLQDTLTSTRYYVVEAYR
jgi:hypothetical protein